jgi:tRNA (mo5U34)-methyltransferase
LLARHRAAFQNLAHFKTGHIKFDQNTIEIGRTEDLSLEQHELLLSGLRTFMPWKKGPFQIFGHLIDAEWRSDLKWQRIQQLNLDLKDKVIADIGCHNGYYMYRMAALKPRFVLGIEPVAKHWINFQILQSFYRLPELDFELLGVEHMGLFRESFDLIFCLGILYHHPDPIGLLRKMKGALKKGGTIIIDCQGIPGIDSTALVPSGRYASARGNWFLPTQACLENWIKRSGFRKVQCFFSEPLGPEEQRRTEWANIDSLKEFLDPTNPALTIEGYPAPWRHYFVARAL